METHREYYTEDLSKFGYRERCMAEELLKAWREHGLPEDFNDDEVRIAFNTNSGCVFLTNSDYQTAMMNGDKLESWHNCPYCGHEGFKEDMQHEPEAQDCTDYLKEINA